MSSRISREVKAEIDTLARHRGISKARLIDEALQFHLLALRELPEDIVVSSRLVVSAESMERVAARLAANEAPTAALRELLRGEPQGGDAGQPAQIPLAYPPVTAGLRSA